MAQVASAWREAGGNVYKVDMQRRVRWDLQHACSCKACNHAFELMIIIFCFLCTLFSFSLLGTKEMQRERKEAGPGAFGFLLFLFAGTGIAVLYTIRTLVGRWRKVSTDVFVSEV